MTQYLWKHLPINMSAEWFGVGRIPPSGTMGTVAAIPILWLIHFFTDMQGIYLFTLIISIVAWVSIYFYQKIHGGHDASQIVIDEVAGIAVTFCFFPLDPTSIAIGFVLFRFFDILKPYPIHLIDRYMHSSLGVLLDDLLAGVYAGIMAIGILAFIDSFTI